MKTVDIQNIDARGFLKQIPSETVDLIVTDPPYRVIGGGRKGKKAPRGMLAKNDGKIFKHNDITAVEYLPDLYRVIKPSGHLYLMTNLTNLSMFLQEVEKSGFHISNILVWVKQNATACRAYMKNCEFTIFAQKKPCSDINDCGSMAVVNYKNPTGNKHHPTEKPVGLMKFYIENSSKPGDTVLDPFMGSGATGVAAVESSRKFIGSEIDEEYFPIAQKRIEAAAGISVTHGFEAQDSFQF